MFYHQFNNPINIENVWAIIKGSHPSHASSPLVNFLVQPNMVPNTEEHQSPTRVRLVGAVCVVLNCGGSNSVGTGGGSSGYLSENTLDDSYHQPGMKTTIPDHFLISYFRL